GSKPHFLDRIQRQVRRDGIDAEPEKRLIGIVELHLPVAAQTVPILLYRIPMPPPHPRQLARLVDAQHGWHEEQQQPQAADDEQWSNLLRLGMRRNQEGGGDQNCRLTKSAERLKNAIDSPALPLRRDIREKRLVGIIHDVEEQCEEENASDDKDEHEARVLVGKAEGALQGGEWPPN